MISNGKGETVADLRCQSTTAPLRVNRDRGADNPRNIDGRFEVVCSTQSGGSGFPSNVQRRDKSREGAVIG